MEKHDFNLYNPMNESKIKRVICPECKEISKIKIEDYKLNFYDCKNGHNIKNILLNNNYIQMYNINKNDLNFDKNNEKEIINNKEGKKYTYSKEKIYHEQNEININDNKDFFVKK